ncbi:rCG48145 [Rattus norvegicus]|uniref:RCG48145 n=1 Tax=Rattus norvegicus TaxID=10116 RepID=A6I0S9_RAT|nr:rCG48145 [Rattus norvegicus]
MVPTDESSKQQLQNGARESRMFSHEPPKMWSGFARKRLVGIILEVLEYQKPAVWIKSNRLPSISESVYEDVGATQIMRRVFFSSQYTEPFCCVDTRKIDGSGKIYPLHIQNQENIKVPIHRRPMTNGRAHSHPDCFRH